jgi:hypothetical protein
LSVTRGERGNFRPARAVRDLIVQHQSDAFVASYRVRTALRPVVLGEGLADSLRTGNSAALLVTYAACLKSYVALTKSCLDPSPIYIRPSANIKYTVMEAA